MGFALWHTYVWLLTNAHSCTFANHSYYKLCSKCKKVFTCYSSYTTTCMLSHVWLCDPMDCSPAGISVRGISQARILEWVAISYSRGSSGPGTNSHLLCILLWQVYSLPLSHLGSPKKKKNEKRQAISDSLIIMLLWNIKTFLMLPKCLEWGARDSSILDHMKFFTPRMDLQVLFVEQ